MTRSAVLSLAAGTLAACAGATAVLLAQSPQVPAFKAGVELVAIDVNVVDRTGSPVRSLRAEQFEVTVDGRPRRVISAEIVEHAAAGAAAVAGGKAPERRLPSYSTNAASPLAASTGRLFYILIDQASFRPTGARGATEAARRFLDRLQPSDRVGLLVFPPPGASLAASLNHEAVRTALKTVMGTLGPSPTTGGRIHVSLTEAIDIVGGDTFALTAVVTRECQGLRGPELMMCQEDVQRTAQLVGMDAERQARQTLDGLRGVVDALLSIPERKTLVLVSAGFPSSPRGGGLNVDSEVLDIARNAGRANANFYVLHVDNTFMEAFSAESGRISDTLGRDASNLATGLETMAGASGGTVLKVISTADAAFDRILKETAASYVLGLEPADSDRDGKPHTIRVNVKVPGAQVRARREFLLPRGEAAAAPADPLAAALSSRQPATALPLGLSTHVAGTDAPGNVRVLITADVGRDLSGPSEFKLALVVTNAGGRVVFAGEPVTQQLRVAATSENRSAVYMATIGLPAGEYTLRLAAVDATGRAGAVDHPFTARLGTGDGITMTDLLLLNASSSAAEPFSAVADGRLRAAPIDAHLEVFGKPGAPPPGVTFGVADRPDGNLLIQVRGSVSKRDAKGRCTADAVLDLALLPPGDYYAVAIVSDGKRRLGSRHEAVRIDAVATTGGNAGSPGAAPRVRFFLGDSSALVRSFARADVLAPTAIDYFLARLQAADTAIPPQASEALSEIKVGHFEAVVTTLRDVPSDHLSVPFLRGIGLLAAGQLDPAANEFRAAARIADDFLPAAFFLGACYAEGGRDDEAVGAWQTALVTEGDARIVYDVLADALLRLEDAGQAIDILKEAGSRWPEDDGFLPRLAVGQAMLGRRREAFTTLQPYLDRHPADTEAAALAIRLIYEARAAGQAITTEDADREAATAYGEAYRGNGGRNQALIDRWLAFIEKK